MDNKDKTTDYRTTYKSNEPSFEQHLSSSNLDSLTNNKIQRISLIDSTEIDR